MRWLRASEIRALTRAWRISSETPIVCGIETVCAGGSAIVRADGAPIVRYGQRDAGFWNDAVESFEPVTAVIDIAQ